MVGGRGEGEERGEVGGGRQRGRRRWDGWDAEDGWGGGMETGGPGRGRDVGGSVAGAAVRLPADLALLPDKPAGGVADGESREPRA